MAEIVLDGKGGNLCEHGNATATGTQGKLAGRSIVGVEFLIGNSKIGNVCPDTEVVLLPQFKAESSITTYLNKINIRRDRDIKIVNNYKQPTLTFDGEKVGKSVTLVNNNVIKGDIKGSPALKLNYDITLINKGMLIEQDSPTDKSEGVAIDGIQHLLPKTIIGSIKTKTIDTTKDELIILPKFDTPADITEYVNRLGNYKNSNLMIFNNVQQPTLVFNGYIPAKTVTFTNNHVIYGNSNGSPALVFNYPIKLINRGILRQYADVKGIDPETDNPITGIEHLTKGSVIGRIETDQILPNQGRSFENSIGNGTVVPLSTTTTTTRTSKDSAGKITGTQTTAITTKYSNP